MYIIQVTFRLVAYISLIRSLINKNQDRINDLNFENVYNASTKLGHVSYRSNQYLLFKLENAYNFNDAWSTCTSLFAAMYSVEEDDNLDEIFSNLAISETWSSYEVDQGQIRAEGTLYPPKLSTLYQSEIEMKEIINSEDKIVLKKLDNKYAYFPEPKTSLKTSLCKRNLSYPRTKLAIKSLNNAKQSILYMLAKAEAELIDFEKKMASIYAFYPRIPDNKPFSIRPDQFVTLGQAQKTDVQIIGRILDKAYSDLLKLDNEWDLPIIINNYQTQLDSLVFLLHKVKDYFVNPLIHVPSTVLSTHVNPKEDFEVILQGIENYILTINDPVSTTAISSQTITTFPIPSTTLKNTEITSKPVTSTIEPITVSNTRTHPISTSMISTITTELSTSTTLVTSKPSEKQFSKMSNESEIVHTNVTEAVVKMATQIQHYIASLKFFKRHSFYDTSLWDISLTGAVAGLYVLMWVDWCWRCCKRTKPKTPYKRIQNQDESYRVRKLQLDHRSSPHFQIEIKKMPEIKNPTRNAPVQSSFEIHDFRREEQKPIYKDRSRPIMPRDLQNMYYSANTQYNPPPLSLAPVSDVKRLNRMLKVQAASIPLYKTDSLISL